MHAHRERLRSLRVEDNQRILVLKLIKAMVKLGDCRCIVLPSYRYESSLSK